MWHFLSRGSDVVVVDMNVVESFEIFRLYFQLFARLLNLISKTPQQPKLQCSSFANLLEEGREVDKGFMNVVFFACIKLEKSFAHGW